MSSAEQIRKFDKNASRAVLCLSFFKGLIRALPCVVIGVITLSVLDRGVEVPIWGLRVLWVGVAIGSAALFATGFMPLKIFSMRERSRSLHLRVQGMRTDELRIAVELARAQNGPDAELKDVFLERAAEAIRNVKPAWCFPLWNWKTPLVALVISSLMAGGLAAAFPTYFSVSQNAIFPFASRALERAMKIEPGDAIVPMGQDAAISLTMLEQSTRDPILQVRTNDGWAALEPDVFALGKYVYTVKKVTSPLYYRVIWKKESSRRFTLTPEEAAQFTAFSIEITPPEYLGKPAVRQESPEISGLAGSQVRIEAKASTKLDQAALIFSDGREVRAQSISGTAAVFQFTIDQSGTYSYTLQPKDGDQVKMLAVYPVHVTLDMPPSVTLLSPDQDVVVGQKERLPLTYDARDDHGLGEAALLFETRGKGLSRLRIKKFDNADSAITTYDWDLSEHAFQPGELVRFQIEVLDRNTLTGPGKAVSGWRVLEIKSFEQDHAMIEKALEMWRDKAVQTLAQVNTLKSKVDSQNADMSALSGAFNQPARDLQMLEESLKQIVNKMENDPFADYGVWLEHKNMEENLQALNQGASKEAQAAFQTQNKQAASSRLDEISNEIERMTSLSENLSKSQKARDVMDAGEKLEDIGSDLMKALESDDPTSALSKIKDLINEAQKSLMEMAQSLQQMPEDLPEDFVNQEALKNLELGKSQDILSQIMEAVKSGDMKKAMALAQKFSEMAKNMKKQISKAHESFLEENAAEKIEKQIAEHQASLKTLTDEQRKVLSETQALASKQLEQMMKEQGELLAQLAARQEKVLAASRPLPYLLSQIVPMEQVAAELNSKRLDRSPEWLNSIVTQLAVIKMDLSRSTSTAAFAEKTEQIQNEENEILEIIKNPPQSKPEITDSDRERHADLQKRQDEIRKNLQSLKQKLQGLSQKTATLGPSLMRPMNAAGNEMKSASDELSKQNSPSAQRHEENALESLLQGQDALGAAKSAMAEMSMEQGSGEPGGQGGQGGPKVIMRNSPGGSRGNQSGKVKLPTAEDYRPPKAFREDLMESLKENYPQIYEEIIHKYYKRLAE